MQHYIIEKVGKRELLWYGLMWRMEEARWPNGGLQEDAGCRSWMSRLREEDWVQTTGWTKKGGGGFATIHITLG